ncbi:MAG: heavy-metal-associated domain-containing protein [Bacteroidales bacterium]|nr:heavy-metal-associated domain-containing protein [Bacteroidales bacterium]
MKKIVLLLSLALFGWSVNMLNAQADGLHEMGIDTITIQTNGVCQKCADRFMTNVPYFKGVTSCEYDMKTSRLRISYQWRKTNPNKLRQQISKLGYNADEVPANPKVRAKLPACCRMEERH